MTAATTAPADITASALASFNNCGDARLRELMQAFVSHLHQFAYEVELTEAEWRGLVAASTATSRITADRRH